MEEKEGWGLTEEEIKERPRTLNQEKAKRGPTRGGRSSGQGVKFWKRYLKTWNVLAFHKEPH